MSDIQEVYGVLSEIDRLLADIEVRISNISGGTGTDETGGDAGGVNLTLRQQFRTLNMMGILIEQMTGDKNVNKAVQKFDQFLMVLMRVRMFLFVVQELEAGTLGGPWGWAYAAANAIGFGMSLKTLGQ